MVTELTVQQRLDYWKRKIGIGSVWITQEFNTSYVTVLGVEYDKSHDMVVVCYTMNNMPGLLLRDEVRYFLEYAVSHRA